MAFASGSAKRATPHLGALALNVDVDGEVGIHETHLVLEALGHARDEVLRHRCTSNASLSDALQQTRVNRNRSQCNRQPGSDAQCSCSTAYRRQFFQREDQL
jgi:hypothetical protein